MSDAMKALCGFSGCLRRDLENGEIKSEKLLGTVGDRYLLRQRVSSAEVACRSCSEWRPVHSEPLDIGRATLLEEVFETCCQSLVDLRLDADVEMIGHVYFR